MRTELDRALDPDGVGGQVGDEVSGAGWRGPGRTGVGDLGREPQVGEETAAPVLAGAASDIGDPAKLEAVLINGQKVDLEQWKGKVVMVNFSATRCAVCQTEMPGWQKFYEANREKGFEMIALSVDDGVEEVNSFMAKKPYCFPVAWRFDKQEDYDFPTVRSTPTTYFVDKRGKVALKHIGRMSEEFLAQTVNGLLTR